MCVSVMCGNVIISFQRRTCIVGAQLDVKICCFGSVINQTAYPADYCYIDEEHHSLPMPIRWMAWESILLVSGTTNSAVL